MVHIHVSSAEIPVVPNSLLHLTLQTFERFSQDHYDFKRRKASKEDLEKMADDLLRLIMKQVVTGLEVSAESRLDVETSLEDPKRLWRVRCISLQVPGDKTPFRFFFGEYSCEQKN